jgi:hypothetical protein
MAAPTLTIHPVTDNTGSPLVGSQISTLDFGNVQAGYWSDAKAIIIRFSGNTVNSLKLWLNDTVSTGANTDVSTGNGWSHYYNIDSSWQDPDAITDLMKAGTNVDLNGNTWVQIDESEPGSSNFETDTTTTDPEDSDYIYLSISPDSGAGAGVTTDWSLRASYLYP